MISYPPIDMHKKKSEALVIHCADPRFQPAYRHVIDSLNKYIDLLVSPGASKAVVDDKNKLEYIKLLYGLHQFDEVHVMDHVECGAFGPVDDETKAHGKMLEQATSKIKAALPELKVFPHLLGEKGEISL